METSTQILRISMELDNKTGESRQHIWNVFVESWINAQVTDISEEPERIMKETFAAKSHLYWNEYVYAGYS